MLFFFIFFNKFKILAESNDLNVENLSLRLMQSELNLDKIKKDKTIMSDKEYLIEQILQLNIQ